MKVMFLVQVLHQTSSLGWSPNPLKQKRLKQIAINWSRGESSSFHSHTYYTRVNKVSEPKFTNTYIHTSTKMSTRNKTPPAAISVIIKRRVSSDYQSTHLLFFIQVPRAGAVIKRRNTTWRNSLMSIPTRTWTF